MVIFFDLDDTLLDYTAAMRAAAGVFWAEHLNIFADFSVDSFLTLWESLASKCTAKAQGGEISWQDQQRLRMQDLYGRAGRSLVPGQAEELFGEFYETYRQNWSLFPDVLPCLDALAAVSLGIISNGEFAQQHRKLQAMRIQDRFWTVVISSQVGVTKPDPAIFLHACDQASALPGECVYVGDQLESDARAAVEAGMLGIWLDRAGRARGGLDIESIRSLAELPALLGIKP